MSNFLGETHFFSRGKSEDAVPCVSVAFDH